MDEKQTECLDLNEEKQRGYDIIFLEERLQLNFVHVDLIVKSLVGVIKKP